jgi:hypothetical protein
MSTAWKSIMTGIAVGLVLAACEAGEDQRGTAPGAAEQPGTAVAPDYGPSGTPTTDAGMAPSSPSTGPGAAPPPADTLSPTMTPGGVGTGTGVTSPPPAPGTPPP